METTEEYITRTTGQNFPPRAIGDTPTLCFECNEMKPRNAFRRDRRTIRGCRTICVGCEDLEPELVLLGTEITKNQKECTRCGKIKDLGEFGDDITRKGGHRHECRDCYNHVQRYRRECAQLRDRGRPDPAYQTVPGELEHMMKKRSRNRQ